ncbi:MAG: HNH endonuclease [Dethiobacter sp.]|nr:HNH endonuclease [Dethiobacter sp.]
MKAEPEQIIQELHRLLNNFELELQKEELRPKVLSLVPVLHTLRALGISLAPEGSTVSARQRILQYFLKYPLTIINGDELSVISGIQEYARRVRELRVEYGWAIISGTAAKEMYQEEDFPLENIQNIKPDDYILLSSEQDKQAAFRWNLAKNIRNSNESVRNKILEYLKQNVGEPVTGEELRYVAKDKTEWARRVRELRTEYGWPIVTKTTGKPDLPVGTYLLESTRQSPEHDRIIPDPVRGRVLRRDNYTCVRCQWNKSLWDRSDPRHLELHHVKEHAKGGKNTEDNLVTLCTVCHDDDDVHRKS